MSKSKSLSSKVLVNMVSIFASRVFGLARDIACSSYWGATEGPQAAFNTAFAIPNMLRMLFGEGAFNAAFVPMIAGKLKDGQKKEAEDLASKTVSLQALILASIVIVGAAASAIVSMNLPEMGPDNQHVSLTFRILPLLLPYAIFICLAGSFGAILNCLGRFAAPSLNPVLFNAIQIGSIVILYFSNSTRQDFASLLFFCIMVFVAGIVQMALLFFICRHNGFNIRFEPLWRTVNGQRVMLWQDAEVKTLCGRILPGLIGAGAFQLNALVDKAIAVYIGAFAVGSLVYCQHLVYLPIGIFGVAIGMVCLPKMSNAKEEEMADCLDYALRQVLFMTLPCMTLLAVLSEEAIVVLYQRDAFNETAVKETLWAMRFLLPGLPAFCCAKVAVTTHHGRKDTKTPVKVSLWCILLNLILNLSLFPFLRQGGLALATAVCSWVNVLTLLVIDTHKLPNWNWRKTLLGAIRLAIFAFLAAAAAAATARWLAPQLVSLRHFLRYLTVLLASGCVGGAIYLLVCGIFRAPELMELLSPLLRRVKKA